MSTPHEGNDPFESKTSQHEQSDHVDPEPNPDDDKKRGSEQFGNDPQQLQGDDPASGGS